MALRCCPAASCAAVPAVLGRPPKTAAGMRKLLRFEAITARLTATVAVILQHQSWELV